MMNTREEFEKWHIEEFGYAAVAIEAHQNKYFQDPVWMGWQACQALNDKRIAELEEKLRAVSKMALDDLIFGVKG